MKNQTGKYFKYAIGEIVLVVIGILIALQINNWNENRKHIAEEQILIFSLKEELKNNIDILQPSLEKNQNVTAHTDSLVAYLTTNQVTSINQTDIVKCTSYFPNQSNMPVLQEILRSDAKLVTYKNKIIDDLRHLNATYSDMNKNLYYLDEIYNKKITEFTIDMGFSYEANDKLDQEIPLSFFQQNGYRKDQIVSLLSLQNVLRKEWIESQQLMIKKLEQLLEKLN